MWGVRYPKPIAREDFDKAGSILMLGVSIEEFGPVGKASRELTRRVIAENDADVLAVQEAAADASELEPLLGLPGVENVVACLPAEERWTHYYKRGKKAEQLDYLMLSLSSRPPTPAPCPGSTARASTPTSTSTRVSATRNCPAAKAPLTTARCSSD